MKRPGIWGGRRRFVQGALWAGAAWLYGLPTPTAAAESLDPARAAALEAVLDTLIPADDYAGALDAGVPGDIAAMLAGSPRRLRLYRRGLDAVERRARETAGAAFTALAPDQRTQVLGAFRSGYGAGAVFLYYVRRDAMTSFYSSPLAYEMLGYQPPLNGYPYQPAAADSTEQADG